MWFSLLISSIIISGLLVILSKNPMHSVLSLVLTFVLSAILMIVQGVEFLGLLFLIVYVGAIAILFLFVVMMLNIKLEELLDNSTKYAPISIIIGSLLALEFHYIFQFSDTYIDNGSNTLLLNDWSKVLPGIEGNIYKVGQYLYTEYFPYFIIASMILLVSMIGAIVLTLRHESGIKRQDIFSQITR